MCGGPGIDIVPVARIADLIGEHGDKFLRRWFTTAEIEYCNGKAVPSRHFAARFAAKEAVAKVLPAGWNQPLPWRSIEIVNTGRGAPVVRLSGTPLEVAQRAGLGVIRISLSHCDEYATAIAISTDNGSRNPTEPALSERP
jgi:holo-[acyl-carrier protein] synthase